MHRLSGYRLLTVTVGAGLAALLAGLWPGPTAADGPLLDLLIKARAAMSRGTGETASPVSVVAVDARTLADPELAPYPRTFLAPVWATVLAGLFQAGATAVGF